MRPDRDLEREERRLRQEDALEPGRFAEPRSWMARTRDEIASWFGDTGAMRRRQWDEAAGDHSGEGPVREADEDARIIDQLNQRLTVDHTLDATDVRASASDGVVTLEGSVTTSAGAQRAESLALAIHGVRGVVNNLVVA